VRHFDRDAREILADLRGANTEEAYVDLMWGLRYPKPSPKSSNGWPFRCASETPTRAIRVVK
jgi:hypothetical protein